jgi:hypothetical protein
MIPIHAAPCAFFVSEGLHEPPGLMREYSLPIICLVISSNLGLSLYRMLAELCNTESSRYFEYDGKRVQLNDASGIHTSIVTVYSKVEHEKPRIA